jgi:hypothetical protein
MAGARWGWKRPLAAAALILCAATVGFSQTPESGSLIGKLTDLHSVAVDGATVLVRNQSTGIEAHTTTLKGGTFRFSALDPGEYTLEAESPQLGRGRVEGIVVDAGHEARVQTAMEFAFGPPQPFRVIFRNIEPERVAVVAMLEPEPLPTLALRGRRIGYPLRALPGTVPLDLEAALDTEPLQPALHVSGMSPLEVRAVPVAEKTAEKLDSSGGLGEVRSSGAKAPLDPVGVLRGLKPPPPSVEAPSASGLSSSAASVAPMDPVGVVRGLKPSPPSIEAPSASGLRLSAASENVSRN